jgi:hypothetical protein
VRWFGVAMLIVGLVSLGVVWRAFRDHPRGALMRRGWTGFIVGLVLSSLRWMSDRADLLWVAALLSLVAYAYGAVYMVRFIRADRRE